CSIRPSTTSRPEFRSPLRCARSLVDGQRELQWGNLGPSRPFWVGGLGVSQIEPRGGGIGVNSLRALSVSWAGFGACPIELRGSDIRLNGDAWARCTGWGGD